MSDRFSADGFRTRAARVIRRRVLGVRVAKGKTGKGGKGERGKVGERFVQVIPGRGKAVCVCVGVRSVSAGRGPEGRFTLPHS